MVKGRAVSAVIEALGYKPFTAYACYLWLGVGASGENLEILARVGGHLEAQGK